MMGIVREIKERKEYQTRYEESNATEGEMKQKEMIMPKNGRKKKNCLASQDMALLYTISSDFGQVKGERQRKRLFDCESLLHSTNADTQRSPCSSADEPLFSLTTAITRPSCFAISLAIVSVVL